MSASYLVAAAARMADAEAPGEAVIDLSEYIIESSEDIVKPDLDERKYRFLLLKNNLKV